MRAEARSQIYGRPGCNDPLLTYSQHVVSKTVVSMKKLNGKSHQHVIRSNASLFAEILITASLATKNLAQGQAALQKTQSLNF